MEEVLIEFATSSPLYAVLLYWVYQERKERLALVEYARARQSEYVNVILRLVGQGNSADEIQ